MTPDINVVIPFSLALIEKQSKLEGFDPRMYNICIEDQSLTDVQAFWPYSQIEYFSEPISKR